jgi:threonine aldolase
MGVLGLISFCRSSIFVIHYPITLMANRRTFIKSTGLTAIPFLFDFTSGVANTSSGETDEPINFHSDGKSYNPLEYAKKLATLATDDIRDSYGRGGAVTALELEFAALTGKEKAIFLPSGTMANQLAIKLLSGSNTKVFVQETSHVYRDEADAAQSIHNLRLIPLAKGLAAFTLEELKESIEYHNRGEVFKSGIGAISIENPVRRNDGQLFDFEEIKRIAAFCRENNYKLHLDGARLHIASSYSGVSVKEYASYFDTVYISLYKYLGAAGGAMLSGEAKLIDQIPHLMKIHGGVTYQSWPYAAMALAHVKDLDQRLTKAKEKGAELIRQMNTTKEFKVQPVSNGTNIFKLTVNGSIEFKKFWESLMGQGIAINGARDGVLNLVINETVLKRNVSDIVAAFQKAHGNAR